MTTFYSVEQFV